MRVLTIIERELLSAARGKRLYRIRLAFAAQASLAAGFLLMFGGAALSPAAVGTYLYAVVAAFSLGFGVLSCISVSSDAISSEKRNGTLGLLFLTPLKGGDVIVGKLAGSSFSVFFGLLAVVPLLAVAILLGGVRALEVLWLAGILMNTLFFCLALGITVSTFSVNDQRCLFFIVLFLGLFTGAPYVGYAAIFGTDSLDFKSGWTWLMASPAYQVVGFFSGAANSAPSFLGISVAATHLEAWVLLALASWGAPRVWQEREERSSLDEMDNKASELAFGRGSRLAHRQSALSRNPYYWLATRQKARRFYPLLFLVSMGAIWTLGAALEPTIGEAFAIWLLALTHFVFRAWWTIETVMRFQLDKQSNAHELVLTTPCTLKEMLRGQRMALADQFGAPLVLLTFLDAALASWTDDAGLQCFAVAALIVFWVDLPTLHILGRWHALAAKRATDALIRPLGYVLLLPLAVFAVVLVTINNGYLQAAFHIPRFQTDSFTQAAIYAGISIASDLLFIHSRRRQFLNEFVERVAAGRQLEITAAAKPWRGRLLELPRRHPLITTACLALGLTGAFFAIRVHTIKAQVRDRIAALRLRGVPLADYELTARKKATPPEKNALVFLSGISGDLWKTEAVINKIRGSVSTNGQRAPNLPSVLDGNRELQDELRRAPVFEDAVSESPFSITRPYSFYGNLRQIRDLREFLKEAVAEEVASGDYEGASKDIAAIFKFADAYKKFPAAYMQMQRAVSYAWGAEAFATLLSRHDGVRHAEPLLPALRRFEDPEALKLAAQSTRALGLGIFELSSDEYIRVHRMYYGANPGELLYLTASQGMLRSTGVYFEQELKFLWYADLGEEMAKLPLEEIGPRLQEQRDGAQAEFMNEQFVPGGDQISMLHRLISNYLETATTIRIAEVALGVEHFRERNGRLPKTLDEIGRDIPQKLLVDPYSKKEFHYEQKPGGYVIWSNGKRMFPDQGPHSIKNVGIQIEYAGESKEKMR